MQGVSLRQSKIFLISQQVQSPSEEENNKTTAENGRPSGNKQEKQATKDAHLIKQAISAMQRGSGLSSQSTTTGSDASRGTPEKVKTEFFGKAGVLMEHVGNSIAWHYVTGSKQD